MGNLYLYNDFTVTSYLFLSLLWHFIICSKINCRRDSNIPVKFFASCFDFSSKSGSCDCFNIFCRISRQDNKYDNAKVKVLCLLLLLFWAEINIKNIKYSDSYNFRLQYLPYVIEYLIQLKLTLTSTYIHYQLMSWYLYLNSFSILPKPQYCKLYLMFGLVANCLLEFWPLMWPNPKCWHILYSGSQDKKN